MIKNVIILSSKNKTKFDDFNIMYYGNSYVDDKVKKEKDKTQV